jgi:nicotinate phosphoribosyltransferase
MLDGAGLKSVRVFASSSLEEFEIQRLVNSGAPIDAFGVGLRLAVMEDTPHLDMAYKLVEYGGRQILNGQIVSDVIARFDEDQAGEPLLQPFMRRGAPAGTIDVKESRRRLQGELARLPPHLRALEPALTAYPVSFSECLRRDLEGIRAELARGT